MTKLDFRVKQVVLPTGETHLYLKFYIQGSKLFYNMATGDWRTWHVFKQGEENFHLRLICP